MRPGFDLGREDSLEKGVVIHSSILTWMDREFWQATVHGILQVRILEWVAFRGSSPPRDWTQVPCIAGGFFISWATEYIMQNAGLDEAQAGINISGRNINTISYADETTLMAECEEELKSLLMKVQEESENAGLKLNIQKTKIMASGPISSWQRDGETMETVTYFIFLDAKIAVDDDCSHEVKRRVLLGRKVMTT